MVAARAEPARPALAAVRGDRGFTLDEVLPAFREAAAWHLEIVGRITPDQWSQPGLGEWNLLELAAHASRAMVLVERYLRPSGTIDIDSGADYFRRAMPGPDANAAIAVRGREEVSELGDDPVAAIAERARSSLAAIEQAPPGAVCETFTGTLSLADYLATRVVELGVHTLDLADAMGMGDAEPPDDVSRVALIVLAALAGSPSSALLLRALTGRAPLPPGFSVFP